MLKLAEYLMICAIEIEIAGRTPGMIIFTFPQTSPSLASAQDYCQGHLFPHHPLGSIILTHIIPAGP